MEMFKGNSGRFYVRNPFGGDKYTYAVYDSKKAYDERLHLPEYVTNSRAFEDFEKEVSTEGYLFTIDVKDKIIEIKTDMEGRILNTSKRFNNYLQEIYSEYGKENTILTRQKL